MEAIQGRKRWLARCTPHAVDICNGLGARILGGAGAKRGNSGDPHRLAGRHLFFGAAEEISKHWDPLKQTLAKAGHRLRDHKCKAWCPTADHLEDNCLPQVLVDLHQMIPRSRGGLILLGGAAQGECVTVVGFPSLLLAKAQSRAAQATRLTHRVHQMTASQSTPQCHMQAWFILSKSVGYALSYDARLIDRVDLETVALTSEAELLRMAQLVCTDARLDSARKRQLSLPGCFGGFGLRLNASGLIADAAYYAAWSALSPQVSRYCLTLGLASSTCAGEMQALQARDRLRIAGIIANDAGMVEFSADAKVAYDMSPWGPDTPSAALGRRSIEPLPTAPFPPARFYASQGAH
jgi:hypothetical protein